MFIAQHKKKTNIAEYILYMWQIENLIRSYNLDINAIKENIISAFDYDDENLNKIIEWYKTLIKQMKSEGIAHKGHLGELNEIIAELNTLHKMQINLFADTKYTDLYRKALPNIEALAEKNPNKNISEIELCLIGLYGILVLKTQNKKIGEETSKAVTTFGNLLALLTKKYHEMKQGKFILPDVVKN